MDAAVTTLNMTDTETTEAPVLVLGLGNILLQDEGVGVFKIHVTAAPQISAPFTKAMVDEYRIFNEKKYIHRRFITIK